MYGTCGTNIAHTFFLYGTKTMEDPIFSLRGGQRRTRSSSSSSNNNNSNTNSRRRRRAGGSHPAPLSWKHQVGLMALSAIIWGIWYGTPLSDILLEYLLETVPLEADKDLEVASLQKVKVTTYYDRYWTPIIQDIGQDLVETLEKSCRRRRKRSAWDSDNGSTDNDEEDDDLLCQFSQRRDWNFGLVQEPGVVNAFCFPAGTIRITTGLLDQLVVTRGALAALLGHEMGHVLRRHTSKRMLAQNVLQKIWQTLWYEDHDGYDESWGEALGELLLQSASWLGQQRFFRRDEYQADAVSWVLLQRSSLYNPYALIELLEQLQALEGDNGGTGSRSTTTHDASSSWVTTLDEWSRTHPATADRIEALRDQWTALPLRTRQKYKARTYS